MKNQIFAFALLSLAGTTAALAAPQETFDYVAINGAPLIGTGAPGGENSTVSATSTGTYTARSVTLTGDIGTWGAGTWGSESRVQLTLPDGSSVVFGPFSTLNGTPAASVSFTYPVNVNPQVASGNWIVEPYETYNDIGVDDATFDQLTLTIDDVSLPVGAPASSTDLGDFTLANRVSETVVNLTAGSEVRWFKVKLPAVNSAGAGYVDIYTTNLDPTQPVADNELDDDDLALYSATTAQLISYDDLSGPGYFGQLSYGSATARPATAINGQSVGAEFVGANGSLAEGFYYLALGQYPVTHPTDVSNNWGAVASTAAGTRTDTVLHIRTQLSTAPYPPTGTGASSPASVLIGGNILLTVAVLPGGNPTSTGISVHGDLTGMGGPATQLFYDDGTHGDATAGDGTFSYSYTVPVTATEGDSIVAYTITDTQARSNSGTIAVGLDAVGDLPATAAIPSGTGSLDSLSGAFTENDVDMYRISICDPASFTAATAPALTDTQLFLFNLDGTGVASNDDNPDASGNDSIVTGAFVPAAGDYYIAVTRYNTDPVDAGGNLIWNNTPFRVERAPDGPGAAEPVASWTGPTAGTLTYTITFTGTCYPSSGSVCGPADLGGTGGVAGADGHLDNNDFIVYIDNFFNNLASADIGTTGGVAGSDGLWDNNDFIVFIDQFFAAPASCR